jgi:hypothetical protein
VSGAYSPNPPSVRRRCSAGPGRSEAGESGYVEAMLGVSDLEIYQRFTAMAEELDRIVQLGPSLVGGAALDTACRTLRGMAAALYEHSIGQDGEGLNPH